MKKDFLLTPSKAWMNVFEKNERALDTPEQPSMCGLPIMQNMDSLKSFFQAKNFAPGKDDRDGYVR